MSKAIEALRSARQRINPEGLAVSAALSYASPAVMIPMEAGITYVIHEVGKDVDPNLLKILAIGLIAAANTASVAIETNALRKQKYSASPVGSTLNVITGKPVVASVGEHLVNYAQLSILNPINVAAIASGDNRLLIESAGSTSLALTLWLSAMNTLILHDKIQPVVDSIKKVRHTIVDRTKPVSQSIGRIFTSRSGR